MILQVSNLTITHTRDLRVLLEGLSFTVSPGAKCAIIGEEGGGKSTLLKLLHAPHIEEEYYTHSGEISFGGVSAYLAQELAQSEKELSVLQFFEREPLFYTYTPAELFSAGRTFNFSKDFYFSPQLVGTLSGGEQVKLQLVRMLLSKPDILLLDEPSNSLDLETLRWLETFIAESELPVVFISHDETLLERTANMIIHIEHVQHKHQPRCTVAKLPYTQYMLQRGAAFERQSTLAKKQAAEYEKQQQKQQQIYERVAHEQATISRGDPGGGRLLKKRMKTVKSQQKRMEKAHENDLQLPSIEQAVFVAFPEECRVPAGKRILNFSMDTLSAGEKTLAQNISLEVVGPQKVCITGRNGCGKTSLLREIAVALEGTPGIRPFYMPQNYDDILAAYPTALDFLAPSGTKEDVTRARTYLGSMKYTPAEMLHNVLDLSGGQRAKLFFLKMVLDGCNVLVLDEPTRNLSALSAPVIRDVLAQFGGAIISVSHDRKYIAEVCETFYTLTKDGLLPVEKESLLA